MKNKRVTQDTVKSGQQMESLLWVARSPHRKEREESRKKNGSDSPTCSLIIDPTSIVFSIVSIMMALVFLCSMVSQSA